MVDVGVVYQRKERVIIVAYDGKDYLVKDEETGKHYSIDSLYFRSHYESKAEALPDIPVHQELWDKLHQQATELFQMKCANTALKKDLKGERKKFESLRKTVKPKQHVRKGQKRGSYGRHG